MSRRNDEPTKRRADETTGAPLPAPLRFFDASAHRFNPPAPRSLCGPAIRYLLLTAILILFSGCSLFETRTPEPPLGEAGTFVQPDTPEQVVANVEAAVEELSPTNYRRSLADAFTYKPSDTAAQQFNVWSGWDRSSEERYFSALVAAATVNAVPQLSLNDQRFEILSETQYVFEANYVLNVPHRDPDAPTDVQGHLVWELLQDADGLWRLAQWTDQELGNNASWSTLKAEFVQ